VGVIYTYACHAYGSVVLLPGGTEGCSITRAQSRKEGDGATVPATEAGDTALPMTTPNIPHRGSIVVDLDGTICEHRYPAFGEPIVGAKEALQRLKAAGFWIVIHTVRTSSAFQAAGLYEPEVNSPEAVSAFLQRHEIPYDEIWMHDKPLAIAYIDDRNMRLVGNRAESNWHEIVAALVPWEPRPTAPAKGRGRLVDKCTSWKQYVREGGLWPSLPWRKRGSYSRE